MFGAKSPLTSMIQWEDVGLQDFLTYYSRVKFVLNVVCSSQYLKEQKILAKY